MVEILKVSYSVFKNASATYPVYHFPFPGGQDGYVLGTGHSEVVYTTTIEDPADISDFIANLLPSSNLSDQEGDVIARPTLQTTGKLQQQYDLSIDGFIYIGKAIAGVATSSTGWTIDRFILDSDGNVTEKKSTETGSGIWDNRVSETYV